MENKKGMGIVIVLLGIIIVALAAGFIFLFMQMNTETPEAEIVYRDPALTEMDIRAVSLTNAVTTNLYQSPGGTRHVVRVDVGIGINDTDSAAADYFIANMMDREIAIMDRITNILRRTTRDELSTQDGMDLLADRILPTLQDLFDTRMIVRIYLGNMIVQ